jgi:hypothetical protein
MLVTLLLLDETLFIFAIIYFIGFWFERAAPIAWGCEQ